MNCNEVKYYLNDYLRGILLDEIRGEIHKHLNECMNCAKALDEIIVLRSKTEQVRSTVKTEQRIKESPLTNSHENAPSKKISSRVYSSLTEVDDETARIKNKVLLARNDVENNKLLVIAGIVSTLALGVIFALLTFDYSPTQFWQVQKISGYPVIESQIITDQGILKIGERLVTDSESRARLKIGTFGEIDIEPQSEIKIIETKSSEYQLVLSKGKISVRTWAAPKLFSIETPSASVKDFGSIYYLSVDEKSITKLQVKTGWVLIEANNIKSLSGAASICYADKMIGCGAPFSIDASDAFQNALHKLNFENGGEVELEKVLSESRKEDLISLFHLLTRSQQMDRERIYNRITQLFVIPQSITRKGIIIGDQEMLGRLWTEFGLGSISIYQNL
jgi:hypothetical protein